MKKSRQEWVRQQIKVGRLKDARVRREYQAMITDLFEDARTKGCTSGTDVELAWKNLKEGIVGAARKVCGTTRMRRGEAKRTRWWNEECAVRRKKVLYRRLLDSGTEEAKQLYIGAKQEVKRVVRNATNKEWEQLGKELEKDAKGNLRSFWARVNKSRRSKESMTHIHDKNGEVLSEETEVIGRWKEHFEGLLQKTDGPYQNTPWRRFH